MMIELPLFPLNTVLFPGMPLQLHIFEERYKMMISTCLETSQPFGVALIESGQEALRRVAEPYSIGCMAQIGEVLPLNEGCLNLVAIGTERFRIQSLHHGQPYLVGTVDVLSRPELNESSGSVEYEHSLRRLLRRYLQMLGTLHHIDTGIDDFPDDLFSLVYLSAHILQIPTIEKQQLLEIVSADMTERLYALYRREVALLMTVGNIALQVDSKFSPN